MVIRRVWLTAIGLGTLVGATRADVTSGGQTWEPLKVVARPAVPLVAAAGWQGNPIDAFVAARHAQHGLRPAEKAAKHVLLRRVYLDLTGLPPTREALNSFVSSQSPGSYERIVEQLLDSPQYGERWGRHWMDIWRYSDWAGWTDGGQIRDSQPHIWRWRDWIVESLNADKGYDRMLVEMLAADEIAPTDFDALRATGYLVRNYKMLSRETWMQDVIKHSGQAFLAMTLDCARCHDHRYDAISQEDYYRVRAIFEPHQVRIDRIANQPDTAKDGLARVYDADPDAPTFLYLRGDDRQPDTSRAITPGLPAAWGDVPFDVDPVVLPPQSYYPGFQTDIQEATIAEHEGLVAQARAALDEAGAEKSESEVALAAAALRSAEAQLAAVRARIAADRVKYSEPERNDPPKLAEAGKAASQAERQAAILDAELAVLRVTLDVEQAEQPTGDENSQAQTNLAEAQKRLAEANKRLEAAEAAALETSDEYTPLTGIYPTESSGRRLALAQWITDRRNPLTARVAANHIWQRHFGQAIVPTVFDFGNNGRPPTHPALLDWLAAELIEPTWQLETDDTGAHWRKGSATAVPWSMKHVHRLIVTSNTYRMASTHSPENAGIDPDNQFLWKFPARRMEAELVRDSVLFVAGRLDLTRGGPELDQNQGFALPRRSIYFRHAQEKQMEFLKVFDCAAVTECYERKESIVPQQALAMMNGELTLASARALARELSTQYGSDADRGFVEAAFESVLSRPASELEIAKCAEFLANQRALLEANEQGLPETARDAGDLNKPAAESFLRARENLVQVLFNHNDFVTIR